jgi:hypothetical protein
LDQASTSRLVNVVPFTGEYLRVDSPPCEVSDFDDRLDVIRQMREDGNWSCSKSPFLALLVANFEMYGFVATLPALMPSTNIRPSALNSLLMVAFLAFSS